MDDVETGASGQQVGQALARLEAEDVVLARAASTSSVCSPSCARTTARLAANRAAPSSGSAPTIASARRPRANQRSISWLRIARKASTWGENGS